MAKGRFSNPFSAVFTGVYELMRKKVQVRSLNSNDRFDGKTCLITGANSGLGYGISRHLVERGAQVIMACRSGIPEAGESLEKYGSSSQIQMEKLDLTDRSSIMGLCQRLKNKGIELDVAIFNAGVAPPKARKTKDGLDEMFMVNYFSKFIFINQLINHGIISSSRKEDIPRIIIVSSDSHQNASAVEIDQLGVYENYKSPSRGVSLYSYFKLVLNTFAIELSRRLKSGDQVLISVNVICPGPVDSNIIRDAPWMLRIFLKAIFRLFFKAPYKAAEPVIYLAVADEMEAKTGHYLHMKNPKRMDEKVYDPGVGKALWERSERLLQAL